MKQKFNTIAYLFLLIPVLACTTLPQATFATTTLPVLDDAVKAENFCKKFDSLDAKFSSSFGAHSGSLKEKEDGRVAQLKESRNGRDVKMDEKRNDWDLKDDEYYSKLESRAKNEAQLKAVATFRTAITKAVNDRRVATDAALAVYRKGVDQLLISRRTAIETLVKNYETGMKALFAKAKADCTAGVDGKKVRTNLKDGVGQVKNTFKTNRQTIEALNEKISPILAEKKQALIRADANFKAAVKRAQAELRVTLGE
jgi:hypothetical protein